MKTVRFLASARRELLAEVLHYNGVEVGLGAKFVSAFEQASLLRFNAIHPGSLCSRDIHMNGGPTAVNFNEYETKYFPIYEAFAKTVRFILEQALLTANNLPRPQSIQCRPKAIKSLRRRLIEEEKLETNTLDLDRRDLAGVRLIFYTDNHVDRFLESRLIFENFKVEEDSIKIHLPTPENKGSEYRAIHYTVGLHEARTSLPEYARFAGLRCEIQIQTILIHAWAETSHDILYRTKVGDGYGGKAMKSIEQRFDRIMKKYLLPAGFEFQIVQQEYERLLQGKALFDMDIVNLLDNAQSNNDRYLILSRLKDVIPNYDDLTTAYEGLKGPLLRAVKVARSTEPIPMEITYGTLEGFKADAITKLVVEIIESLRYFDVVGTLQLLIDIYRDEPSDNIRQRIIDAVKNLSEYNIDAYRGIGPTLQISLIDHLASMNDAEVDIVRPIALTVWKEALQLDITGRKFEADSVVFSRGVVPASNQLREVRAKAVKALFAAYDRSTDDAQKREVFSALHCATRTPSQDQYSDELLAITLKDAIRIVEFMTERTKAASYGLLQHLEHRFFHDYFRAESLAEDQENRFGCQAEAAALVAEILKFRNTINADDWYVRYKVLVGFESVFPHRWIEKELNYKRDDEYRRGEADRYIDEINAGNETDWFGLITRCAQPQSNDVATFNFISRLAERKPEVAERFLTKAPDSLHAFLAAFLNGLAMSNRPDIYERVLESELDSARNLAGLAHHLRHSDTNKPDLAARLLKRAIDNGNPMAVIECLLLALEHYGTERIADADALFRDALTFLNDIKDSRWVEAAWFVQKTTKFYAEVSPERTAQILQSLGYVAQVDYKVENILVRLAECQLEAVWDFFGTRFDREAAEGDDDGRFEAVPFQFRGLEKELSKDPQLAIRKGLSWFAQDRKLFRFRGGHLLSIVFPHCTPEFATALAELVRTGDDSEADFALAILQNYEGVTSTYAVLKEIVSRFPDDPRKMTKVRVSIESTGVVCGDFGIAEAWQARKESLTEWLADERPAVKEFAEKHISKLNLMITSELRSAEAEREMLKRSYDEDE
jgi:ppGpp synthetase/RelA/SpoT-type nucleotidyltranferase